MVSAAASFTHGVFRRVTVFSAASFSRFDTSRESAAFAGDAISLTAAISPGYSRKRPEATALPYRAPAAENTLADSGSKIAGRAVTHSQTGLSQ